MIKILIVSLFSFYGNKIKKNKILIKQYNLWFILRNINYDH